MFFSEINMNTSAYFIFMRSLSYVMNLLIIFEIKIYRILPISLTDIALYKVKARTTALSKKNLIRFFY